ncbi:hypothetical protein ACJ7K1_13640 [Paenibacillus elgii]
MRHVLSSKAICTRKIWETKEEERNGIPNVTLQYRGRYIEGEDTERHSLDDTSPEPFRLLLQRGWPALLTAVSRFEYYRSYVKPEQISEILSLPLVEPLRNRRNPSSGQQRV